MLEIPEDSMTIKSQLLKVFYLMGTAAMAGKLTMLL